MLDGNIFHTAVNDISLTKQNETNTNGSFKTE